MRAIWTFKTLSDQLDPFWLSRESHLEELIDPKQLYLRLYRLVCVKWCLKEPVWLQLGAILFGDR